MAGQADGSAPAAGGNCPGRGAGPRRRDTLDEGGHRCGKLKAACLYYVAVSRSDGPGNVRSLDVWRNLSIMRSV